MTWYDSTTVQPEQAGMVEVSHGGDRYKMWYEHGLWFFEDRKMYVYYTPEYWRYL